MLNETIAAAGMFLLDVVYPRWCAGCGARGTWLCSRCSGAPEAFAPPFCLGCGLPQVFEVCMCEELPPSIERVRSVGPYGGWVRGAVIQMKYHGEWARARHLAPLLAQACTDLLPADAVIPVPLHASRRKQRGFNQAEILADALAHEIGAPVQHALHRIRRTSPQVRLDGDGRRSNVEGAFALLPGVTVRGARLILVDDVITTGATLGACAEVLRVAGAEAVSVITVARELLSS